MIFVIKIRFRNRNKSRIFFTRNTNLSKHASEEPFNWPCGTIPATSSTVGNISRNSATRSDVLLRAIVTLGKFNGQDTIIGTCDDPRNEQLKDSNKENFEPTIL